MFYNNHTIIFAEIFTFSAKERDVETGLSYFGARYYSSELSIWLSVDPMSGKYPSLSPYVYCADNPVKLVDPNGEEIVGTDGKSTSYSYDSQGNVVWSSNTSEDTKRIGNALLKTETGKEQLDFLIHTDTKVTLNISSEDKGDVMGVMSPGNAVKNKDESVSLSTATITIYEGSINTYLSTDNTLFNNFISDPSPMGMLARLADPTVEEFIGAEACHEIEHLKPENILLNHKYGRNNIVEQSPNQKKAEYLFELYKQKK